MTAYASGTTLTNNATLLSQFEALYPNSTNYTSDLTAAYNALATAVTASNITSANITTINTDWSAVLAASKSTSTATFPYFTLVTGQVPPSVMVPWPFDHARPEGVSASLVAGSKCFGPVSLSIA